MMNKQSREQAKERRSSVAVFSTVCFRNNNGSSPWDGRIFITCAGWALSGKNRQTERRLFIPRCPWYKHVKNLFSLSAKSIQRHSTSEQCCSTTAKVFFFFLLHPASIHRRILQQQSRGQRGLIHSMSLFLQHQRQPFCRVPPAPWNYLHQVCLNLFLTILSDCHALCDFCFSSFVWSDSVFPAFSFGANLRSLIRPIRINP